MATKFDKMVTYLKLPNPMVMWYCKITRLAENIISSLPQHLWALNMEDRDLSGRGFTHKVTRPFVLVFLRDHVKPIIFPLTQCLSTKT